LREYFPSGASGADRRRRGGASHADRPNWCSSDATSILFGPFALNVAQRTLRKADDVIPLGGRAFDILLALLDRPGEIVSKADLIARVWPDVTVEEGSLRVHLSALRKALGDGQFGNKYITNVQGRGYCFAAPVTRQAAGFDMGNTFPGLQTCRLRSVA
jgi:DNA-binding winged helix-turn-helix (wHTH) protein